MNSIDLFNALGKIDEKYIESAVVKKTAFYKKTLFKFAVAAAVICLTVGGYGVASMLTQTGNFPEISYSITFEGMGYEGTDELSMINSRDINPWNEEAKVKQLPVYKNLCYNNGKPTQTYFSASELKKQAELLAERLELKYESLPTDGEAALACNLETDKARVNVFSKGNSITVERSQAALIEKHIRLLSGENSDKKAQEGIYAAYSVDGEHLSDEKRIYYKSGNITEDIISFNMQSYYLIEDEAYLTGRQSNYLNGSEKIGDYPIIELSQAKKKLLRGEYISSAHEQYVKGGKIAEDIIAKADLIYYVTGNPEYYLPYYRFFVEYTPGESTIKQYAYFYVCAVQEEYIGEISLFNGDYQ